MLDKLPINYAYTSSNWKAKHFLDNFEYEIAACDFESTGLGYVGIEELTHFSIAWSPTDAFTIIIDNPIMERIVLKWIIETNTKQIWHNAQFDFKYIEDRTGIFPKDYEDTAQLAKSLLNHVDVYKAKVGLKELMGWKYGDWAISADHFGKELMYTDKVNKYASIDAMATYHLWLDIQYDLGHIDEQYYKQRTDIQKTSQDDDDVLLQGTDES